MYVENNDHYRVIATLICLILSRREMNDSERMKQKKETENDYLKVFAPKPVMPVLPADLATSLQFSD